MELIILVAAFGALGIAGSRWGADSRDGADWKQAERVDRPRVGVNRSDQRTPDQGRRPVFVVVPGAFARML